MNGGNSRDFRRFGDEHKDEASRWLDREILGRKNREHVVKTLIHGIDTLERLDAWFDVELALERGERDDEESGPRRAIVGQLNQRRQTLTEAGERRERAVRLETTPLPAVETEYPDRPDVETDADRSVWSGATRWGSLRDRYPEHFDDELGVDDGAGDSEVAADGGEQQ